MQSELDRIDAEIAEADYRAANIRSGYVYVISNIGAFGEGLVKIGMTRRLDPLDRVQELGDASVPFTFDVHALFFSDDAVGVEAMLHREFAPQRLNQVNHRKEFFRVHPQAVLVALVCGSTRSPFSSSTPTPRPKTSGPAGPTNRQKPSEARPEEVDRAGPTRQVRGAASPAQVRLKWDLGRGVE